jgi:hypothetical protein
LVIWIPEYVTEAGAVGVAGPPDAVLGGAEVAVREGVAGSEGLGGSADLVGFGLSEVLADGEPDVKGDSLAAVADCDAATSCARPSLLSPPPGTSSSATAAPQAMSTTAAADNIQARALRPLPPVATGEVGMAVGASRQGGGV